MKITAKSANFRELTFPLSTEKINEIISQDRRKNPQNLLRLYVSNTYNKISRLDEDVQVSIKGLVPLLRELKVKRTFLYQQN